MSSAATRKCAGRQYCALDQRVEAAEAVEVAGRAVEHVRGARDRSRRVGIRLRQRAELRLQLPGASADVDARGRKVGEGVAEPLKRRMRVAEDARRSGADRSGSLCVS